MTPMTSTDTDTVAPGHLPNGQYDGCPADSCQAAAARGDQWMAEFLSIGADGILYFHHDGLLTAAVEESLHREWCDVLDGLKENPESFVHCWNYLRLHPIFWRYGYAPEQGEGLWATDDEVAEFEVPRNLVRDDGLAHLYVTVGQDEGGTYVSLEHGPHQWSRDIHDADILWRPLTGVSTHDPRLDVCEDTYESAIVAMAHLVRDLYGDDRSRL